MRYPIDGNIVVTGEFKEKAQPGTGLPDTLGVRRHVGVDIRAKIGTFVYAPAGGVVTQSYGSSAGQTIEIRINGLLWRFMHLSERLVRAGDNVAEGHLIAKSGNSGGVAAHLHVDVRTDNTSWSDSLNNYHDFRAVITDANKPKTAQSINWVPSWVAPGKTRVYASSRVATWRCYKPGTREVAGTFMPAANGGLSWIVRGIDTLPNRVLIQSGTFGRVSLPVDQDATFA
jgi:murein DD-endopeptidase MepM/ murein hydrolase activator NlpD